MQSCDGYYPLGHGNNGAALESRIVYFEWRIVYFERVFVLSRKNWLRVNGLGMPVPFRDVRVERGLVVMGCGCC